MKLNIIREFLRLCETKNYTHTAEELYISQSVLSRYITALEEELGVQLIKNIRAVITRYPFMKEVGSNQKYDISSIPSGLE